MNTKEVISLILGSGLIGTGLGYYIHLLKYKNNLKRIADIEEYEKVLSYYPSNSSFLTTDSHMRLSANAKIKFEEISLIAKFSYVYTEEIKLYFHTKKLNKSFKSMRILLLKYNELIRDNFEQADGCGPDIFWIRNRDTIDFEKKKEIRKKVNEIDLLAEKVISEYKNFQQIAKKELIL